MKPQNKKKLIKYGLFSSLFIGVAVTSFVVPIAIDSAKLQKPNVDYSDTPIGNKNRVDDFLNNSKLINSNLLQNSLEIYGKKDLIGEEGKKLTPDQRSFITIETSWRNYLFKLNLSSKMYYELYNHQIDVELAYVKPNKINSSAPTVGIRFIKGEYSRIYEYDENYLYGFQKSIVDNDISQAVVDIKKNANKYFNLKTEKGKIGDAGIYTKNINPSDLTNNTGTKEIEKLNEKEYLISITNVKADNFVPSKLIITYDIFYKDEFIKTSEKTELNGFDIEEGVDDPISKVKNYIKKDNSLLKSLHQYFKYDAPKGDKITVEDAYKQNLFSFKLSNNAKNSLEQEGIDITFDLDDKTNKLVYTNINDSTMPVFVVNVISYKNQGNQYSEKYSIEGIDQRGEFKKSQEEEKVNSLSNYIIQNNILIEDFVDINLDLKGEFEKYKKSEIPFSFVLKAFEEYKKDENKNNKAPFAILLTKKKDLPDSNMNLILEEVLTNTNNYDIKDVIQEINDINNKINISITYGLGERNKNQYLELIDQFIFEDVFKDFMNERTYFTNQIQKEKERLISSPNELIINYVNNQVFKEAYAISKMRDWKLTEIFAGVSILNPTPLEFPKYDSQINVWIDFNWWLEKKHEEIEEWINKREIIFKINIYKEGSASSSFELKKGFDDLFDK